MPFKDKIDAYEPLVIATRKGASGGIFRRGGLGARDLGGARSILLLFIDDHPELMLHTSDLVGGDIGLWPRRGIEDQRLSDHFGVWCDFGLVC